MILFRNESVVPVINPFDEPKNEVESYDDGNGDDDSRKEICPQSREECFSWDFRVGEWRFVHTQNFRFYPSLSIILCSTITPLSSLTDQSILEYVRKFYITILIIIGQICHNSFIRVRA